MENRLLRNRVASVIIILALFFVFSVGTAAFNCSYAAASKKTSAKAIKLKPFKSYMLHESLIGGPETESWISSSSVNNGARIIINDRGWFFTAYKPGKYTVTTSSKATSTSKAVKRITKFKVKKAAFDPKKTGFKMVDAGNNSVSFTFKPNGSASAYKIRYRKAGEDTYNYTQISQSKVIEIFESMIQDDYDSPDSYITISDLDSDTAYEFRLMVKIKGKWKKASSALNITIEQH